MPAMRVEDAVRIIDQAGIRVDNPRQISAVLSHQGVIQPESIEEAALRFLHDSQWSRKPSQPDIPERRHSRSKTKRTPYGIRIPLCSPLEDFHRGQK